MFSIVPFRGHFLPGRLDPVAALGTDLWQSAWALTQCSNLRRFNQRCWWRTSCAELRSCLAW